MNKNAYFRELLVKNMDFLLSQNTEEIDTETVKSVASTINKEKITILSGLRFTKKLQAFSAVVEKTNIASALFYFNSELDSKYEVQTYKDLEALFELAKEQKHIKCVVLQHIGNIDNIKEFIKNIYNCNYKVVIIGNDIKINNAKTLYFYLNQDNSFTNELNYGNLVSDNQHESSIQEEIITKRDKIILEDIIKLKTVSSIDTYYKMMTFLSEVETYESIRELHRRFYELENISLKTFMDYLEYSEQSEIIEKIYLYDCKKEKINSANVKHFFIDTGFRNSFTNFYLHKNILVENYIYIVLKKYGYKKIYGGTNGTFDFSFLIQDIDTAIHIFTGNEKNELKKQIHKLQKVPVARKILLVSSFDELGIRKMEYDDVEIQELKDFQI